MRKVGSRELKNRLGRYLGLVEKGETLLVTDRGKPVAKLVPASQGTGSGPSLDELLKQLEAEGHLRLGTGPFTKFKAVRAKGKPASRMIIEDRR